LMAETFPLVDDASYVEGRSLIRTYRCDAGLVYDDVSEVAA